MKWLKAYFNFSKGETIGFTVLSIILILLLFLPVLIDQFSEPYVTRKEDAFNDELRQFMEGRKKTAKLSDTAKSEKAQKDEDQYAEPVYFEFNPNKIGYKDWRKLGLPAKLAHTIENYKEAGGKFYEKTDLKAVYGLNDSIYEKIAPYATLPEQEKRTEANADSTYNQTDTNKNNHRVEVKAEKANVALNSADTAELKQVYGIGPFFASEIVEKREALGGFHDKKQLLTIYRLDTGNLDQMASHLSIDKDQIKPLSLRDSSFEAFLKHPYLDYASVKAIFDYKDKQGRIHNVNDLKKDQIIGEKLYRKIEPYLVP